MIHSRSIKASSAPFRSLLVCVTIVGMALPAIAKTKVDTSRVIIDTARRSPGLQESLPPHIQLLRGYAINHISLDQLKLPALQDRDIVSLQLAALLLGHEDTVSLDPDLRTAIGREAVQALDSNPISIDHVWSIRKWAFATPPEGKGLRVMLDTLYAYGLDQGRLDALFLGSAYVPPTLATRMNPFSRERKLHSNIAAARATLTVGYGYDSKPNVPRLDRYYAAELDHAKFFGIFDLQANEAMATYQAALKIVPMSMDDIIVLNPPTLGASREEREAYKQYIKARVAMAKIEGHYIAYSKRPAFAVYYEIAHLFLEARKEFTQDIAARFDRARLLEHFNEEGEFLRRKYIKAQRAIAKPNTVTAEQYSQALRTIEHIVAYYRSGARTDLPPELKETQPQPTPTPD